ncbi:MAG: DUF2283 domain-containing protein [Verrucomicrobiia bacterium]|jgi:uncharacterized protein YuzE
MKNEKHIFAVKSSQPPMVEVDAEASALYIRFQKGRVAKTIRHPCQWPLVTVDLDAAGDVLGVECVGVSKFNLLELLRKASVKAPADFSARVRFQLVPKRVPATA